MDNNGIEALQNIIAIMDIPQAWVDTTPANRMWWFCRRLIGLILAFIPILLYIAIHAITVFFYGMSQYIYLWIDLIVGPDREEVRKEPINYQI